MLADRIKTKNILVIGDIMLDVYYFGDVDRISPEAPVPILKKSREQSVVGGAANVAANLAVAGQNVSIMSIIGNDKSGQELIDKLEEAEINTNLIVRYERDTTTKIRFLANNHQQLMRLDIEDDKEISSKECKELLNKLCDHVKEFDFIIISDYLKGLLTYELTQGIIQIADSQNIPVIIDAKDRNIEKYKGAFLIKPNTKELHELTGEPVHTMKQIISASRKLLHCCKCKYILTTCGAEGMVLVDDKNELIELSVAKEVYDVTGAGDTVIAYLAVALANNIEMKDSIRIANQAAGIQVAKIGTSTVSLSELEQEIDKKRNKKSKIITYKELTKVREDNKDKKVVFTNGCFDILHVGHVRYLEEAAQLGNLMIVGLNSDNSVRRLKGADRPINTENDRAEMLETLNFVDYIVIFDEDTPYEVIQTLQPDILVKGGDYCKEDIVGGDIVEKRGGTVVVLPYVEGKSTTGIINKITER